MPRTNSASPLINDSLDTQSTRWFRASACIVVGIILEVIAVAIALLSNLMWLHWTFLFILDELELGEFVLYCATGGVLVLAIITGMGILGVRIIQAGGRSLSFRRIYDARVAAGRCGRCGYDLTGNTSGQCPECGEER